MSASAWSGTRYTELTAKSSEIARALALSCIAIAWLFSGGLRASKTPQDTLDALAGSHLLFWAIAASVLAIALDLWQYALSALRWGAFHWALDQALLNDTEPAASWRLRLAYRVLWWFKAVREVEAVSGWTSAPHADDGGGFRGRRERMRDALAGRRPSAPSDVDATRKALDSYLPASLPRLATVLFALKLMAVSIGYVSLALYLKSV